MYIPKLSEFIERDKSLMTFESYSKRNEFKKYFVKYSDDMLEFGGYDINDNFKMNNMLISNIFDEVVILEDMKKEEIDEWIKGVKEGDKIYSYSSKLLGSNTDKGDILKYVYNKLIKKKGIEFWMNDTYTKDKKDYYNLLKGYNFMPKTVFSKKEALTTLKFPVVGKPIDGGHGIGIEKFETKEELLSTKSQFGLYSEYVEHKNEFRVYVLDGKVIYIIERLNIHENKNNIDTKSKNERIKFVYIPQELKGFPYLNKIQTVARILHKELKGHVNSIYSIDLFITPTEKVKVIESNSKSEVDPLTFIVFCKNLFDIPYHIKTLMEDSKNLFLKSEYEKHKSQIKKSFNPISYKTKEPNKEFLKYLDTFKSKEILSKNKK